MPPRIRIIGLGPGDPALLTRQAWVALSQSDEVHFRTGQHPIARALPAAVQVHTFDHEYAEQPDFTSTYRAIVDRLLDLGRRPDGVTYAVPGDPGVGESTTVELRRAAAREGIPVEIVPGVSFVEPCLALVGWDALDGLSLADALDLAAGHHPPFSPDRPALIGQLYSAMVAADVKLTLMNQYPDEHTVTLIHAAGTSEARTESCPLHAIDRSPSIGWMTSLFVPALSQPSSLESFQETVAHLRAPDGCPWDREQTPLSLRPHLLEETYEALQALDAEDADSLREELGDLLLQIVLQAQIATEGGEFTMADVIAGIDAKLVRRHPHVFGDLQVAGVDQVLHNWEVLKAEERQENGEQHGLLGGVPIGLPALAQALEIQDRVARVGFDWPDVDGVLAKIAEELGEVQEAADDVARAGEVGDLLFAVVNYARWLGVDPEAALRQTNRRFRSRFGLIEASARASGSSLPELTPGELDALWEAAKRAEGGTGEREA